jgi:hypothetical protein
MTELATAGNFGKRLHSLLNGQALGFALTVATLAEVMQNDVFPAEPWSAEGAVGRRVVARYPQGHILTITVYNELTYANIDNTTSMPILPTWLNSADWERNDAGGCYLYIGTSTVVDILLDVAAHLATPSIVLPWQGLVDVDQFEEVLEEIDEDDEDGPTIIELLRRLDDASGNSFSPETPEDALIIPDVTITSSDDLLPPTCAYNRFMNTLSELEDNKWIVLWNECCGTCASGALRDIQENDPERADAPVFVLYGQNAADNFNPDGTFAYGTVDTSDTAQRIFLLDALAKNGLNAHIDETSPEGAWLTVS